MGAKSNPVAVATVSSDRLPQEGAGTLRHVSTVTLREANDPGRVVVVDAGRVGSQEETGGKGLLVSEGARLVGCMEDGLRVDGCA